MQGACLMENSKGTKNNVCFLSGLRTAVVLGIVLTGSWIC